jgi:hypothetical protein
MERTKSFIPEVDRNVKEDNIEQSPQTDILNKQNWLCCHAIVKKTQIRSDVVEIVLNCDIGHICHPENVNERKEARHSGIESSSQMQRSNEERTTPCLDENEQKTQGKCLNGDEKATLVDVPEKMTELNILKEQGYVKQGSTRQILQSDNIDKEQQMAHNDIGIASKPKISAEEGFVTNEAKEKSTVLNILIEEKFATQNGIEQTSQRGFISKEGCSTHHSIEPNSMENVEHDDVGDASESEFLKDERHSTKDGIRVDSRSAILGDEENLLRHDMEQTFQRTTLDTVNNIIANSVITEVSGSRLNAEETSGVEIADNDENVVCIQKISRVEIYKVQVQEIITNGENN